MTGYRKIRAVKVKAARRKIARKRLRWRDKVIIRCQGGGGKRQTRKMK